MAYTATDLHGVQWMMPAFATPGAGLDRRPACRAPAPHERGQGASLLLLTRQLLRQDLPVDVGVDGGED